MADRDDALAQAPASILDSRRPVEVNDDSISTAIVRMAEEGLVEIVGDAVRLTEKGRAEMAKREARHV